MEILRYDSAMLPELTSAYNNLINGLPHCYPVRDEDFAAAVAAAEGEQRLGRLHSETAFVVRESASIRGFAHIGIESPEKTDETGQGIIRFLWYDRGHRIAGQTLLDAAEEVLGVRIHL